MGLDRNIKNTNDNCYLRAFQLAAMPTMKGLAGAFFFLLLHSYGLTPNSSRETVNPFHMRTTGR